MGGAWKCGGVAHGWSEINWKIKAIKPKTLNPKTSKCMGIESMDMAFLNPSLSAGGPLRSLRCCFLAQVSGGFLAGQIQRTFLPASTQYAGHAKRRHQDKHPRQNTCGTLRLQAIGFKGWMRTVLSRVLSKRFHGLRDTKFYNGACDWSLPLKLAKDCCPL